MNGKRGYPILKLALFVLIVCLTVTFIKFQFDFNAMKAERELLADEIAAAEERIAELNNKLSTPFDDDYIIGVAREKLNLRLPEEIVFYSSFLK